MAPDEPDALAEVVAGQLLARWGVVVWELWQGEQFKVPWREVVRALRRLEARGQVVGGRFVAGLSGEQFALPEAADLLAAVARASATGESISVGATDPLNVTGTVLPGARVPSVRRRTVTYRDGLPIAG
jgi:ATP-dependent Lhr-like helicase